MSQERNVSDTFLGALGEIEQTLQGGTLGVAALFLPTGEVVRYNAAELFPTASVIKAPIVAEWLTQVAEGRLDPNAVETIPADALIGGSGILSLLQMAHAPGLTLPLRDLATLAIAVSDNTASNRVLEHIGGPGALNRRLHEEWGLRATTVHRPICFMLGPDDPPHTATTTPDDMLQFLGAVVSGRLHSPPVSRALWEILETCQDRELLPRYLGATTSENPCPFVVAHKSGAVNGVRNDIALVTRGERSLAISAFSRNCLDMTWTPANAGAEAIARVGKLLCEHFFG